MRARRRRHLGIAGGLGGRANATRRAMLASALGYDHVVFDANLERDGAFSGNAVVSRWPIRAHEVRVLPRTAGDARDDEGEERLVVFAEIDGPRGAIQVYCAHLSWRDDHSAIRQAQVAEICRLVRERRPRTFPAVLVRRPQCRADERRAADADRPGRRPGAGCHVPRRVARSRQHRHRARPRRTRTRSTPRRSTATAASTSCWSAPRSSEASVTCSTRGSPATHPSTACGPRTTSRSSPSFATDRFDRSGSGLQQQPDAAGRRRAGRPGP